MMKKNANVFLILPSPLLPMHCTLKETGPKPLGFVDREVSLISRIWWRISFNSLPGWRSLWLESANSVAVGVKCKPAGIAAFREDERL